MTHNPAVTRWSSDADRSEWKAQAQAAARAQAEAMIECLELTDLTETEGAIVSTYALSQCRRGARPARDPLIDAVCYTRCEWMKPQPVACKQQAFLDYQAALKAWRESRTA